MIANGIIESIEDEVKELKEYFYKYEKAQRYSQENNPEFKAKILGMYLAKAMKIIQQFEIQNKKIQKILIK